MKLTHFINGNITDSYADIANEEKEIEKKYKFFLDNITNYIYITDRLIFIRENDDYKFELEISNKPTCLLTLIKENKCFDINVISSSYKDNGSYIDIEYELESDDGDKHHIILEIEE